MAAAEFLIQAGKTDQAKQIYSDAMTQYDKSCSLSSSDDGDDLPGLLNNWGVGLHSAGCHLKVLTLKRRFPEDILISTVTHMPRY